MNSNSTRVERINSTIFRDLVILFVLLVVVFVLAVVGPTEDFLRWLVAQNETNSVLSLTDEAITVLVFSSLALTIFILRRWRELKEVQEELHKAMEEAESANRAK